MVNTVKKGVLTAGVPQLPALDLTEAVLFYCDKLGFALHSEYTGFAILKRDAVEIHLWHCTEPIIPQNSSCYTRVEDIDSLYRELTAQGVSVQETLGVRPWGMKEFSVLDPSGNALRFGEPQ